MKYLNLIIKMVVVLLLFFILSLLITINGTNNTNATSIDGKYNHQLSYINNELSKKK